MATLRLSFRLQTSDHGARTCMHGEVGGESRPQILVPRPLSFLQEQAMNRPKPFLHGPQDGLIPNLPVIPQRLRFQVHSRAPAFTEALVCVDPASPAVQSLRAGDAGQVT